MLMPANECRHWEMVERLQSQEPPCPHVIEDNFCSTAAADGQTGLLAWARLCGHPWNADTSYAAFINGHFEALFWLRHQQPPSAWTHLQEHWQPYPEDDPGPLPAGSQTDSFRLHQVLRDLLKHAASPRTGKQLRNSLRISCWRCWRECCQGMDSWSMQSRLSLLLAMWRQ